MNTTIPLTNYPIFTPNQVLNNTDLNRVVEYLEGLDQLTRTYFVGMGVAYGLEVQHLSGATIQITPGCGITSEGFVIQVRPEFAPKNTLTHYNDTTISSSLFIPRISPEQHYSVKELFPEPTQSKGTNLKPLTEEILADQVVVVLYDWQDTLRSDTCFLSYDNLGQERNIQLRFFLIPKVPKEKSLETNPLPLSSEELLRAGYPTDRLPQPWQPIATQDITAVFEARNRFFPAFNPKVQRFGYDDQSEKSINLSKINTYETWQKNYVDICEAAIVEIGKAFPDLFRLFSPFFSTFHPDSKQDFANLEQSLKNLLQRFQPKRPAGTIASNTEPPYALQYFYDYLSQLVAASVELVEAVFDLMDQSIPETGQFPRFLMLGLVPPTNAPLKGFEVPSAYRTQFIQPRIYNNNQYRLQEVRHLYERLLKLCDLSSEASFYLLPFYRTPIKITPSKDRSTSLSEQAIPYYLSYPKLYQYWNYDAYRKGRSDRLLAYFYPKKQGNTTPPVFDDLIYRLDAYNFYRIEGHIGRSNAEALQSIQYYQERYSLPFDVITLKLGDLESLNDLNISAQLDDLNATFIQLKTQFLSLWAERQQDWSKNVLLVTLKKVFFEQPNLEAVNSDLLFNHFLYNAKKSERYEFEAEADNPASKKYRLFLKNAVGTQIAQYKFRTRDQISEILNFTGLETDKITQKQKQIIADLQAALTPTTITYAIERQSPSLLHFYLRFVSKDNLTLPLDQAGSSSEESVQVELVSLDTFSIQEKPELKILEPTCPDVITLYGLLRDVSQNDEDLKFKIGDQEAAKQPIFTTFTKLIDNYNQRLEQWLKLHLFHNFAQQHPGMEPLGGVPKGGTFILVYVDGHNVEPLLADEKNRAIFDFRISRAAAIETVAWLPPSPPNSALPPSWEKLSEEIISRKDIVVADFCLPYRSSSNAPAVSYVLARPRPVLLLQKTIFCEGDGTPYAFILEPEGGTVKGEGVILHEQQFAFQPSSISKSSQEALASGREIAITFSYAVHDTYDTLTVTVYPLPRPNLTIEEGQNFCQNASPVEIELAPGALETVELELVKINGTETRRLDPSQFAANGQAETITIETHLRDRQSNCTNTLTTRVTINPLPEANLSVNEGQSFCQDAASVEITLAPSTPADVEMVHISINDAEARILDPKQYAVEGQPQTVTITARIRSKQTGCENTLTRRVTINPLPEANLSVSEGQSFCQDASFVEITLAPGTPEEIELLHVTINDIETNTLTPKQYATQGQPQTITIAARIRNQQTQCETTLTRKVTVHPLPQANLFVSEGQSFFRDAASLEIGLAPDAPADVELVHVTINGTPTTTLIPEQYATHGQSETVTIEAHLRDRQSNCTNTVTRQVTIIPLPEANLSVSEGQSFCQDASPVEITLDPGTPAEIELLHVTLNGTTTNTLVPSQYATQGQPQTVTIAAQIRDQQTQRENTLTRTVTINPLPEAILSIQEGQNFCQDASPVEITLALGTPAEIELRHVTINGTATNTLAPSQYATQGQPQTITISARIRNQQTQCENTLARTVTVHPLPIADFKAEITKISGTGFSVRVFDIQPAGQPSFTFNWDIPNGSSNPSNPGSSEFTIDYNFDFNNWVAGAEVSITLRVSTPPQLGGCISQPVTKTIAVPFGSVQALNLLTISPDGDTTNSTPLGDSASFPMSSFTTNYTFEAVAIGQVSSVVFTYTDPNGNITTSPPVQAGAPVNGVYYFTMLGSSGHYWPWQPTVGRHQIKAQAFKESNGNGLEGVPLTVTLTVTDGNASPPPSPVNPNPPNLLSRLSNFLRPANPQILTPQAVDDSLERRSTESHRSLNLFGISPVQPSSSEVQSFPKATVSLLPKSPSSSNQARRLASTHPAPAQANTRLTNPDTAKSDEQPHAFGTFECHLNNAFKVKLTQALALSAAMLLLILGWTYTAKQPRTSTPASASEKIQNPTQ